MSTLTAHALNELAGTAMLHDTIRTPTLPDEPNEMPETVSGEIAGPTPGPDRAALTRAYLNLGIMQAQANGFARAAEMFEQAAALDPAFPQVQYSLGVAYFNAAEYQKAMQPLARALDEQPKNASVRRMLALAALNADEAAKAADLLRDDPELSSDPSLQYAYGIALVRSNRAQEAERIGVPPPRHGGGP